jgi:hypothetical protein
MEQIMEPKRNPGDKAHSEWREGLVKLLGCSYDDIVGYVVIVATRDQKITIDSNSVKPEGAIILIDEAKRVLLDES